MPSTWSALVAALCWSYRLAAASNSHVYTIDTPARSPQGKRLHNELSPEIARLVLAQRIGVEDFHDADLERDEVLSAINGYAPREGMFGKQSAEEVLILVEGVDKELAFLESMPSFDITPSPSANSTRGLFLDLARQALPGYLNSLSDDEVYTLLKGGAHQREERHAHRIGVWSETELQTYIDDTLPWQSETSLSITIITISSNARGSQGADFGSYAMPTGAQALLRKRQQPASSEAPLEIEPSPAPSAPVTHNTIPVSSFDNQSSPLPGILPACFPSLSACESTTRNCSGHGSCSKKYTDTDVSKDSRFRDCYACACSATTKDSGSGGVLTTYWGGPACQKKDVSVQFWLIALFTVGLVGLVSFAVGQVWSMGEEELPSVIGAGVSGPVRRS